MKIFLKSPKPQSDLESNENAVQEKVQEDYCHRVLKIAFKLVLSVFVFCCVLVSVTIIAGQIRYYLHMTKIEASIKSTDVKIESILEEYHEKRLKCKFLLSQRCSPDEENRAIFEQFYKFEQKFTHLKTNYFGEPNYFKLTNRTELSAKLVIMRELAGMMKNFTANSMDICHYNRDCLKCVRLTAAYYRTKGYYCNTEEEWGSIGFKPLNTTSFDDYRDWMEPSLVEIYVETKPNDAIV